VGVLVLVIRRETEEMEHSSMYIRLLDITIELCEYLSDFKGTVNSQSIHSAILQLMQERHHAVLQDNSRVSEQNCIICEEVHSRNQELALVGVCECCGYIKSTIRRRLQYC